MLLLIPLFPFVGFLVNAFLGRRLSKTVSGGLACAAMLGSFAASVMAVMQMLGVHAEPRAIQQTVYTWISSGAEAGGLHIPFTLRVDPLASVMILVVTGIGSLIHIYSTGYMHEEPDAEYARYFSYLNLFAAFMLILVLGASLPVMFIGWEGVGLCSYLLIGFWFKKASAADAGKKAFIVNRIGDFGFIVGMLLLFATFGTLDIQELASAVAARAPEQGTWGVLTIATLLLFLGATGKSAQIPLYTWLPDAMEGPTPVSALIHAATMVTAGVYMIGRNAVLFSHAPDTLAIIAVIGVATALMAGTIGLVQNDIKRVLAYSTVSQLGYMFLAMGVGAYAAGIFHLYTHAFFKALLFLGSGAVIHALAGEQDLRNMGGLRKYLPITYWTFMIGAAAIAGVPLLSGFFSKDEILFRTYISPHPYHFLLWLLGVTTSLLTAIYMFRLVFLAFHGSRRSGVHGAHGGDGGHAAHSDAHGHAPHEAPPSMAIPLIVLAIGSVLAGYIGVPHALGGNNWIEQYLHPSFVAHPAASHVVTQGEAPASAEAVSASHSAAEPAQAAEEHGTSSLTRTELTLMGVSTLVAIVGIVIAMYFWLWQPQAAAAMAQRFRPIHTLLYNKYYVDELYDRVVVQPIKQASMGLWKGMDAGLIDGAVNGVGLGVEGSSSVLRRLQTGSMRTYAASLFLGVVVILGYYLFR